MVNGLKQRGTFDSPTNVTIAGRNTSNLNKHRDRCCSRFNAWSSKAPGAVDPNMGAKLAAEEQESVLKQLVEGLVAIQVLFSIFESPRLRSVLQRLAPNFSWPKRRLVAQTATQLYFERKNQLLQEVDDLPSDTPLCGAIDCWTTKDQSESYLAIILQWINPVDYSFCKSIVAFEALSERGMIKRLYSVTGDNAANNVTLMSQMKPKFSGINMTWDREKRFHQCACHVLNLVAKDFLLYMGQLTDEDYDFFDDYLAVTKNSIEDSDNNVGLKDDQASIKTVKRNSGQSLKKRKSRAFNQATLETQDKSSDIAMIMGTHSSEASEQDSDELGTVQRPPGKKNIVRLLRDLCTHIRGSSKQQELFIKSRNKTRDPPLLPISIPMTRWNFFLKQIQRAHQLKLSIQIYTNTPQTDKYHLSEEVWSAMEYMEPILQMFDQACNVFQSKAPSKHLVLPYYQVILNRLTHYASKSPHSWRRACEAAHAKLKKYYEYEMANNDSLIATLLNPKYREGIFKQMGVPPHRAKEVIDLLACECSTLAQNELSGLVTGD
ncbi:hypothetical protein O181_006674 [Austropuccinia psidii MF-1]|uniref:AC transposase n=1 Tax=Austropuccinia psidii MF-1 TaxID=1389203 RepID=A0A9Q3GH43_9BASI|nr:hypothetical protein [Austropuccinia psidii MF-1]